MLQHLTHNQRAFRQEPRNRYLKGFISAPKLNGSSRYGASFCFILLFFKHFWVQHFTALPYHSFQYSSVLPVREWRPVSGQETSIWSTLEIVASLSNMALYLRKEQFSRRTTQYNGLLDQLLKLHDNTTTRQASMHTKPLTSSHVVIHHLCSDLQKHLCILRTFIQQLRESHTLKSIG